MFVKYAETGIETQYGFFSIRVYEQKKGHETVVLWTQKLDVSNPVLVRVHSECLTGDIFKSYQCDCGKQLEKALKRIQETGGVCIYLRQEGRGIGLFEKIKSYQLQKKGYDTFEANILLGHPPDQRTYTFVKTVLDDLNIHSIILMTNNPSKVSEIAKTGIEIVDYVPIISKANQYNKHYLSTKKVKFQHRFNTDFNRYSYQFPVDNVRQLEEVAQNINPLIKDPLLDISVNIGTHIGIFQFTKEINRIHSIFNACYRVDFIPILHVSFKSCCDPLLIIKELVDLYPFVKRIQLNDIESLTPDILEKFLCYFLVHIPLSVSTFHLVHLSKIRKYIKKKKLFIGLDNSGGRGVNETIQVFKTKIETLLGYGINHITLCGGFGPDALNTYCELRRYYKVNFSIDAESKLKTNGIVCVKKVKQYLIQLIRFDDPKHEEINQTNALLAKSRRNGWERILIHEKPFEIHDRVFHPGFFPSTSWFATEVLNIIPKGCAFCEVGCGSGVISCLVALSDVKARVVSTDINPFAQENTILNAKDLGVASRVNTYKGDVLEGICQSDRFDIIFWALPFGYLDPGVTVNLEKTQVFDPGYRAIGKLFQTARNYLNPKGKLLLGFSRQLGHENTLFRLANANALEYRTIATTQLKEIESVDFVLLEGVYLR